jgi:monoamine oxidase
MTDERGWGAQNIREGYGILVEHLAGSIRAQGGEVRVGEEVVAVAAGGEAVTVRTAHARYTAHYAILTLPPPLLAALEMTPAVPEKAAALRQIGYGNVIKILLRFKSKWWTGVRERVFERMFFMFSREEVPTWWTQYPEPHTTLTGWVAGPKANVLQEKSEEEIIAAALTSLSRIFAIAPEELKKELVRAEVFAWGKDPYAQGAYSYYTPGSGEAIQTVLAPVLGRVFYAGEALFVGEAAGAVGGTVEAALASGQAAAQAVSVLL